MSNIRSIGVAMLGGSALIFCIYVGFLLAINPTVLLTTSAGVIEVELYRDIMPVTANNFTKLVKSGFYDNTEFHRVIDGFMIQGGDPLTKDKEGNKALWGTGGPGYTIKDEFRDDPRESNLIGTIAMANSGPNTGGSQFFINTVNNTYLDGKHPVFGQVVRGREVVMAIVKSETDMADRPVVPVVIYSAEMVSIFDSGRFCAQLYPKDPIWYHGRALFEVIKLLSDESHSSPRCRETGQTISDR